MRPRLQFAVGNGTPVTVISKEVVTVGYHTELTFPAMSDEDRDERTGDEWILSVIAYLNWNAGTPWRKLHRSGQRYNETRWYFLAAANLLTQIRHADTPPCTCSLCRAPDRKPMGVETTKVKAARA